MANQITLSSGMRASLFSLQNTSRLLEQTQYRLSTGKKINTSLDDPIKYFASVAHNQRADDLSARKDGMSESVQMIKAADSGIEAITNLISSAKSLANSALSSDDDTEITALKAQYDNIRDQIDTLAGDSGYKGVNFLKEDDHTVKFDEQGLSKLDITGFDATTTGLEITAAGAWDSTDEGKQLIENDIALLDAATTTLRTEASTLASNLNVITARQDFTQKMVNTLTDGASNLVNADMNEEGANMLMLQTRQSLGTTSMSLASQAAQSVLRLF
jgi:flagellin-like hook-associated protein FlgL